MFATPPVNGQLRGWACAIYKLRHEAENQLIAIAYGWSEAIAVKRAEALLKTLQELEK